MSKNLNNYFFFVFSILPISILIGPSVSLINILLIDISFLIMIIYHKNYSFLKNNTLKYFLIFYIYLIINSLISIDPTLGLFRNLGFLRIIIFFVAINYFFQDKIFLKKVFLVWLLIISVVILDIFFENYSGKNIFGFESKIYGRNVSFFKDEHIVGGYLYGFSLILIGYLFDNYKLNNKYLILIFSLAIFLAIFSTGERANSIKAFIGFIVFFFIILNFTFKKKLISSIIGFIILIGFISSSDFLKYRYFKQIKAMYSGINGNIYFKIYNSGFEVFKNYPITGVGNKNYRVESCKNYELKNNTYICTTHPHQIYIEFLSEHGVIGCFLLFYIFYKLIFSKIKKIYMTRNPINLGAMIYLIFIFLPVIPSGAFFSDYSLTFFAINISVLYATNSKLNIFLKQVDNKLGR